MSGTEREPSPPTTGAEPSALLHHGTDGPDETSQPMPPFEPLFALLTNATTNTTVHPHVQYVFSDDDPSILDAASSGDPSHRALVVDLAPAPEGSQNRWAVSWASSLSPDFAVTGSSVTVQQNEGDDAADADDDRRGAGSLMLSVKGVDLEPVEMRPDSLPSSGSGALGREDVEGLAEDFRRRMGVLKMVVDEGEKRRVIVGQQGQEPNKSDAGDDAPETAASAASAAVASTTEEDDRQEKPKADE